MVVDILPGHRSFDLCDYFSLALAHTDSSFSNHGFCKSDGYYVEIESRSLRIRFF
jgi:hypothetical protein